METLDEFYAWRRQERKAGRAGTYKSFQLAKHGATMVAEEKKLRKQGDRHMIRTGFPGEIARDQSRIPSIAPPPRPERGAKKRAQRFGVFV